MKREGEDCGRREMTCGAHMAARGEKAEGTGSGRGDAGPWLASGVGPKGFPGSVFIIFSSLLLFFSAFLNSFTDFAKMFQINLNHFQRFFKKILQGFKSVGKQVFKIKTRFLTELRIVAIGFSCIKLIGI
jgi:hypothetical protein